MTDRLFPRSIVAALHAADRALDALEPAVGQRGVEDEARRELGIVRSELEYSRPDDLLADLPGITARVQRACSAASQAIAERYFPAQAKTSWIGEML